MRKTLDKIKRSALERWDALGVQPGDADAAAEEQDTDTEAIAEAAETEASEGKRPRITLDNFVRIGFHIWRQFDDSYYTGFAAQIAYFFFMACVPTLVVLSQLLGIFDLSLDIIQNWLKLNSNVSSFVLGLFDASSAHLSNIFLVLLALWAASGLEFSLSRLTSYTLTEGTYRFDFFRERVKALLTAIVAIAAIAFALIVFVYGRELVAAIFDQGILAQFILFVRLPLVAALFFGMVLVNYYILPRVRVPLRAVLPGAIVASVGIVIITAFYALYISRTTDYDILYGALASIVALVLWFYLISWVLCIGMMFNKAWDEVMERKLLTRSKMVEYWERQINATDDEEYKKYFKMDRDEYDPENESIAVKMSKKFVKGYAEERRREQEHARRRRL